MGRIKTLEEEERERYEKKKAANKFYMLWDTDNTAEEMRRIRNHIPAPKRHLPSHVESYNPPPEYLLDEEEVICYGYSSQNQFMDLSFHRIWYHAFLWF